MTTIPSVSFKSLIRVSAYPVFFIILLAFTGGCKKEDTVSSSSLYVPTAANVTANATLQELQQGRDLYINNCNHCHGLYSPDSNSPSTWKSILSSMGPRTGLSSADQSLISKYLCKGL